MSGKYALKKDETDQHVNEATSANMIGRSPDKPRDHSGK